MPKHFERETEDLKQAILSLGSLVEESVRRAVQSVSERRADLARQVIEEDAAIDRMEVDIEEECLKLLALYQPVASDLRFIVAILKLNNDLERIGDLAVNIAENGLELDTLPPAPANAGFETMARKSQDMLKKSLDALVNRNVALAQEVQDADDEIDDWKRRFYSDAHQRIAAAPAELIRILHELSLAHQIERIADHATNIAEDVVYLVEGQIVRHRNQ